MNLSLKIVLTQTWSWRSSSELFFNVINNYSSCDTDSKGKAPGMCVIMNQINIYTCKHKHMGSTQEALRAKENSRSGWDGRCFRDSHCFQWATKPTLKDRASEESLWFRIRSYTRVPIPPIVSLRHKPRPAPEGSTQWPMEWPVNPLNTPLNLTHTRV